MSPALANTASVTGVFLARWREGVALILKLLPIHWRYICPPYMSPGLANRANATAICLARHPCHLVLPTELGCYSLQSLQECKCHCMHRLLEGHAEPSASCSLGNSCCEPSHAPDLLFAACMYTHSSFLLGVRELMHFWSDSLRMGAHRRVCGAMQRADLGCLEGGLIERRHG